MSSEENCTVMYPVLCQQQRRRLAGEIGNNLSGLRKVLMSWCHGLRWKMRPTLGCLLTTLWQLGGRHWMVNRAVDKARGSGLWGWPGKVRQPWEMGRPGENPSESYSRRAYAGCRLTKLTAVRIDSGSKDVRKGRGCCDMIFVSRQLLEKTREHCDSLFTLFVDLRKAYDCMPREALWKVLERCGEHSQVIPWRHESWG